MHVPCHDGFVGCSERMLCCHPRRVQASTVDVRASKQPRLAQEVHIRRRAAAQRRQLVGEECCRVGEVLRQCIVYQSPQPALGAHPDGRIKRRGSGSCYYSNKNSKGTALVQSQWRLALKICDGTWCTVLQQPPWPCIGPLRQLRLNSARKVRVACESICLLHVTAVDHQCQGRACQASGWSSSSMARQSEALRTNDAIDVMLISSCSGCGDAHFKLGLTQMWSSCAQNCGSALAKA